MNRHKDVKAGGKQTLLSKPFRVFLGYERRPRTDFITPPQAYFLPGTIKFAHYFIACEVIGPVGTPVIVLECLIAHVKDNLIVHLF